LETFTELRKLEENPDYQAQKQKTLHDLTEETIDIPIINLVKGLNKLPYCFTLQSCYGHFSYNREQNTHNLDPLPVGSIAKVTYRIAYMTFCIDDSLLGRKLFQFLKKITTIDPENIRFCCAEWFWKRQINSYVLQVEPERFKRKDTAILGFKEALHIEKIKNDFFLRLYGLLKTEKNIIS